MSARKYFIWIKIIQDNLQDPVVGWYCECTVGARTVGCCAHVKDAAVAPQTDSELELDN